VEAGRSFSDAGEVERTPKGGKKGWGKGKQFNQTSRKTVSKKTVRLGKEESGALKNPSKKRASPTYYKMK